MVEVFCPLDICRQRNLAREHRGEDQSEEQHKLMARDIGYGFKVNTHENTSEECADLIVGHLFGELAVE
ncbi:hypothetical protein ACFTAO_32375 [Paenibacillus rhizoplanae]